MARTPLTESAKLVRVGDQVAIVLPSDVLAHLGVGIGDAVTFRRLDGGVELSPERLTHERAMGIANRVMKKNKSLLRRLAES